MIGNDGEEYNFLVKFGEDLRQDQRVEQLLQVINNTLLENSFCCERLLSLFTYTVSYFLFFYYCKNYFLIKQSNC